MAPGPMKAICTVYGFSMLLNRHLMCNLIITTEDVTHAALAQWTHIGMAQHANHALTRMVLALPDAFEGLTAIYASTSIVLSVNPSQWVFSGA